MQVDVNNDHDDALVNTQNNQMEDEVIETRTKKQPKRFNDFVVKLPPLVNHPQPATNQSTSTVYPIFQLCHL